MNTTLPPELPKKRHGCLIFLAVLLVLVIVAIVAGYHAVVRTPLPYRMVASMIEKANPNIKIRGITGSFNSGIEIESITWGDDPEKRSEILDLRIKYTIANDGAGKLRVVVHDMGVRKAHFDLADFGPVSSSSSSSSTGTNSNSPQGGLGGLEIERISIEDVLVTDRQSDFRLAIPKIEWTGIKWTPTSLDPGALVVESDRLKLHTDAGRTIPIEGQNVTFQRALTGTVLPALHPAIRRAIPFVADVSFLPEGKVGASHLVVAEGKLESETTSDGGGALHVRHLDLPAFLDGQKLYGEQAADLPGDLVLSAVATSGFTEGKGSVNITGGSFRLGVATFQIEPQQFDAADQSRVTLQATASTDAGKIVWSLPLSNLAKEYHPRLSAAGVAPEEVLARVFAGKPYAELTAEEKKAVDARRPIYFPPPEQ